MSNYSFGRDLHVRPFELFDLVKRDVLHPYDAHGRLIPPPDIQEKLKHKQLLEDKLKLIPLEHGKIDALYRGELRADKKHNLDFKSQTLQKELTLLTKELEDSKDTTSWVNYELPDDRDKVEKIFALLLSALYSTTDAANIRQFLGKDRLSGYELKEEAIIEMSPKTEDKAEVSDSDCLSIEEAAILLKTNPVAIYQKFLKDEDEEHLLFPSVLFSEPVHLRKLKKIKKDKEKKAIEEYLDGLFEIDGIYNAEWEKDGYIILSNSLGAQVIFRRDQDSWITIETLRIHKTDLLVSRKELNDYMAIMGIKHTKNMKKQIINQPNLPESDISLDESQERQKKAPKSYFSEIGRAGGLKKSGITTPILEAVIQFIRNNPNIETNKAIVKKFCRKFRESSPMKIQIDNANYEIFCDGELIISRNGERYDGKIGDNKEKSIACSTFEARYIRKAKDKIADQKI